jgi:hypothetical protein
MNPYKRMEAAGLPLLVALALMGCGLTAAGGTSSEGTSAGETPPVTSPSLGGTTTAGPVSLFADDILEIERASFAAYPWRMTTTALVKATQESVTSTVEAASPAAVHSRSEQLVEGLPITIDAILLGDDLYMQGTGGPAEAYAALGAVEGQWMEIPPGHALADFAEIARLAADPVSLLQTQLGSALGPFLAETQEGLTWLGEESIDGVPTDVVQAVGPVATFRWWIGSADGLLYKASSESDNLLTTIRIEYDPTITIAAPAP